MKNVERENRAQAGANHVGVVKVGRRIRDDYRRNTGAVGAPQYGADIARLFNPDEHSHDRRGSVFGFGQFEFSQGTPRHFGDRDNPFGSLAVSQFLEYFGRNLETLDPRNGQATQQFSGISRVD